MFDKKKRNIHSTQYLQVRTGRSVWYARYTFFQELIHRVCKSPFSVSYTSKSSLINKMTVNKLALDVRTFTQNSLVLSFFTTQVLYCTRYRLELQSTTGISTGIPVENTLAPSLTTLPKALLVVIMYPIDLLIVCLTNRKDTFILHASYRQELVLSYSTQVIRSFRNYYTGYITHHFQPVVHCNYPFLPK